MFTFLITLHILICIGLIVAVLMQSSKGEGLAGAFGGGGVSGAVFGGRGAASFLSKATTVLAVLFMGTCVLLTLTTGGGRNQLVTEGSSAVQDYAKQQAAPVSPGDVQEVNVGQGTQEELPVKVVPNTDQQPQSGEAKQPEGGSGGN